MKKILILFLLSTSCISTFDEHQYTKKNNHIPLKKSAVPQTVKNHIFRFAAVILLLIKRNAILEAGMKHPIITTAGAVFLSKYIYNSYQKHKSIKQDFAVLSMIQELYYLILYASEINNIMIEVSTSTSRSFSTSEHFNQIVKDIPYSFDELEQIAKHILIKWKLKLKEKYPDLPPLTKEFRNIKYIEDVDDTICSFYERPVETYQNTCTKIAKQIKIILQNILELNIIDSL